MQNYGEIKSICFTKKILRRRCNIPNGYVFVSGLIHQNKLKKTAGILRISFFALLLCIALLASEDQPFPEFNPSLSKPDREIQKDKLSPVLIELFTYGLQVETSAQIFNCTPPFSFKNSSDEYPVIFKITEQLISHEFAQFSLFSLNLLIQRRNSNIAYPFQYFW